MLTDLRVVPFDLGIFQHSIHFAPLFNQKKNLIESTFHRDGTLYLACNDKIAFFSSDDKKRFKLWSCQRVCDGFIYLVDNIFIRLVLSYINKL